MNLLRAASTISFFTLLSRITGLVRDVLIASLFGASAWMDAFNVAFRIPNLLRRLFADCPSPVATAGAARAWTATSPPGTARARLIDATATVLFWALLITSAIGIVAAPVIVWLMASGLERFEGAVGPHAARVPRRRARLA